MEILCPSVPVSASISSPVIITSTFTFTSYPIETDDVMISLYTMGYYHDPTLHNTTLLHTIQTC